MQSPPPLPSTVAGVSRRGRVVDPGGMPACPRGQANQMGVLSPAYVAVPSAPVPGCVYAGLKAGWENIRTCQRGDRARARVQRGLPRPEECDYTRSGSAAYETCFVRALALLEYGPFTMTNQTWIFGDLAEYFYSALCAKDILARYETTWRAVSLGMEASAVAGAVRNKWDMVVVFKRLGLRYPRVIYGGTRPGVEYKPAGPAYPRPPVYDEDTVMAIVEAMPRKDIVIKPMRCFQSVGVSMVSHERVEKGEETLETIRDKIQTALIAHCSSQTAVRGRFWTGAQEPDFGPKGVLLVEMYKSGLHTPGNEKQFVFEMRVFVIGGLM